LRSPDLRKDPIVTQGYACRHPRATGKTSLLGQGFGIRL
jgi:hypothetical protein